MVPVRRPGLAGADRWDQKECPSIWWMTEVNRSGSAKTAATTPTDPGHLPDRGVGGNSDLYAQFRKSLPHFSGETADAVPWAVGLLGDT